MAREPRPVRPDRFATLFLDTGAVLALARRDRLTQAFVTKAQQLRAPVRISWLSLAELLPGRDGGAVSWALSLAGRAAVTESDCRTAADLMAETGAGGRTVDALIAVAALRLPKPVVVLTSDPEDMSLLLAGRPGVAVVAV